MKSKDCFEQFFLQQQLIFYKFLMHVSSARCGPPIKLSLGNLTCPLCVPTNQDSRLLVTPKLAILDWVRYDCSSAVVASEYIQRVNASASPRHATLVHWETVDVGASVENISRTLVEEYFHVLTLRSTPTICTYVRRDLMCSTQFRGDT